MPKDIKLSPSSINTWFMCKRKYYNKYVLKLPEKQTIDLVRGSIIHKVLEDIFTIKIGKAYKTQLRKKVKDLLRENWESHESVKTFDVEKGETYYQESEMIVLNVVDRLIYQMDILLKNGKASCPFHAFMIIKPKFREQRLSDTELNVGGILDTVQNDFDGNVIIVDYKTSNKWKNVFPEDYRRQLGIYAYLYKVKNGDYPDLACVNYIRYGESYYMIITPSFVKEAINDIKTCREGIKTDDIEDYPTKEQTLCKWCSFYDDCMKK